ncbi:MAG: hypothetical protein GX126_13775 [Bacteroidales bacterium]|nr:hypothetical protein [Bacteroidales bacterium]
MDKVLNPQSATSVPYPLPSVSTDGSLVSTDGSLVSTDGSFSLPFN